VNERIARRLRTASHRNCYAGSIASCRACSALGRLDGPNNVHPGDGRSSAPSPLALTALTEAVLTAEDVLRLPQRPGGAVWALPFRPVLPYEARHGTAPALPRASTSDGRPLLLEDWKNTDGKATLTSVSSGLRAVLQAARGEGVFGRRPTERPSK
jgi:hypothetical protein